MRKLFSVLLVLLVTMSCGDDEGPVDVEPGLLQLTSVRFGTNILAEENVNPLELADRLVLSFSSPVERGLVEEAISLEKQDEGLLDLNFDYLDNDKTISLYPTDSFSSSATYILRINKVTSKENDLYPGGTFQFSTKKGSFDLLSINIDDVDMDTNSLIHSISSQFQITAVFNNELSSNDLSNDIKISSLSLSYELSNDRKTLTIVPKQPTEFLKKYILSISSDLTSEEDNVFSGFSKSFYTQIDSTYKFPEISDEELLTKIQQQTFKYFWDFGHPASGLARERNSSGNTVTIGGSGFGVMAILAGIERGFITRQEGVNRLERIVNFLETADRFHGVWPHWMDGNTGDVINFSADDDGADLVETAFMIQGLLTVRAYLNDGDSQELAIKNKITHLWEAVEWDWFTQDDENVLTWHWSENFGFQKNLKIRGWNEALIIYVLAAASPTHPIDADVYHEGWARNGDMQNGNDFYDITLPLGADRGGPLFFSHYSFLGLDPRNLEDQYANYWEQNTNHTLINRAYCINNPLNYVGYGTTAWGLTASDNHEGYSAHSPNNDLGVITPTAAISSIPYTPDESMEAIHHFYYLMGDKLWGDYGFYDAYNVTENWYASSYLAIDQGPIMVMIENYRTQLLWDLFMSDSEITAGLDKLGFTSY